MSLWKYSERCSIARRCRRGPDPSSAQRRGNADVDRVGHSDRGVVGGRREQPASIALFTASDGTSPMYDFRTAARGPWTLDVDPDDRIPRRRTPSPAAARHTHPTIAAVKFFSLMRDSRPFSLRVPAMLPALPPRAAVSRPGVTSCLYRTRAEKDQADFSFFSSAIISGTA